MVIDFCQNYDFAVWYLRCIQELFTVATNATMVLNAVVYSYAIYRLELTFYVNLI